MERIYRKPEKFSIQQKKRRVCVNCVYFCETARSKNVSYFVAITFSPRDFNGSMISGRLSIVSTMYPMTDTAIKLLTVMLVIIAAQAGSMAKVSGGGKNSQR